MAQAQRLSRNIRFSVDAESQEFMNNFIVDDSKSTADDDKISVHDPTNDSEDEQPLPVLDGQTEDLEDESDWTSFVMMQAGDASDDYSDSSSDSMPSRPATPLPNLSLEDATSDWIAEFLWESCTAGLGNPKYTFSPQPPAALSPLIKSILTRIPFRSSPCSLYLALWYTSRLPVSFHLPHFAFPQGSPQYDFYMDFIGLGKAAAATNGGVAEGPEAAPYRLFCLGLFFAYKWLEEYDMKTSVWCDIFKMAPRVLNSLEMNALRIFEHTLAIDELEWMRWLLELQCDRPAFVPISRIRPSDQEAARKISIDWLLDHTCLPLGGEGAISWFRQSSPPPSSAGSSPTASPSAAAYSAPVAVQPTPEAYFIGKSQRIQTKKQMLQRELEQLGMTEEEYDAEEDHTPICSMQESLRRVLDSAEAYRSAEDCRIAKAARKEAEHARREAERKEAEKKEVERLRMEKERVKRAEAAAKRAEEQKRAAEAEAKRVAAEAEAKVKAAARWAKQQEWRDARITKWDFVEPAVQHRHNSASSSVASLVKSSSSVASSPVKSSASSSSYSSPSRSSSSRGTPSPKRTSPSPSTKSKPSFRAAASASSIPQPVQRRSSFSNATDPAPQPTTASTTHHRVQQQRSGVFGTVFVPLRRGPSRSLSHTAVTTQQKEKKEGWMEMV